MRPAPTTPSGAYGPRSFPGGKTGMTARECGGDKSHPAQPACGSRRLKDGRSRAAAGLAAGP